MDDSEVMGRVLAVGLGFLQAVFEESGQGVSVKMICCERILL